MAGGIASKRLKESYLTLLSLSIMPRLKLDMDPRSDPGYVGNVFFKKRAKNCGREGGGWGADQGGHCTPRASRFPATLTHARTQFHT